jgi:tetratricopeptide (TPR) repeat protein
MALKKLDNISVHTLNASGLSISSKAFAADIVALEKSMARCLLQIFIQILLVCVVMNCAQAAQWQALADTSRYKVAFDEQSIRLTPQGKLEVWLRFTPRGAAERKAAAAEFREKRYRLHMEYYEIDCDDQSAALGVSDVFGAAGARIKRLQGGASSEPILPGSLLDGVAKRICPAGEANTEDTDEADVAVQANETDQVEAPALSDDKMKQIETLQKKAASKEATADSWRELGNIYFDTDQPELAIKAYEQALALRPDDADMLNDQGAMYRQTGDFERAVANFEKAFAIDPHNLESLYNGGYVYAFDLNNIQKALVLWRNYLELESKSETARQILSFIDRYGK